jgi:FKBP12-rapamycin complex-associated protein
LGASLKLIAERENTWQLMKKVFEEAKKGLRATAMESIHGSLLVLCEMLNNTNSFFKNYERFNEIGQILLKFREHKEKLIRITCINMMPRLAMANPESFGKEFLDNSILYLLGVVSKSKEDQERQSAFIAMGEIAVEVKDLIKSYLDKIVEEVQNTLKSKNKVCGDEALMCITLLAKAIGIGLHQGCGMKDLLDNIFSVGLTEKLVESLAALVLHIPTLLKEIQLRLMDVLSSTLTREKKAQANPAALVKSGSFLNRLAPGRKKSLVGGRDKLTKTSTRESEGEGDGTNKDDSALTALALKTLGSFNLQGYISNMDEFLRDIVTQFLDSDNAAIRKEAALACAQLAARAEGSTTVLFENWLFSTNHTAAQSSSLVANITGPLSAPMPANTSAAVSPAGTLKSPALFSAGRQARPPSPQLLAQVVSLLLVVGTADPEPSIRETVMSSLDPRLDGYLSQPDNLRSLFISLNDEVFEIRELAIAMIGRLAIRNPAYVMPSLRKTLIQLLTELEFSGDNKNKEESAKLIGTLIRTSKHMITPYVTSIVTALLAKLPTYEHPEKDARVSLAVLGALGELALVGSEEVGAHLDVLLPFIVQSLQQTSVYKREIALRALGQLVEYTGHIAAPYSRYPELLDILLHIVKSEKTKSVRREVIKVLGILGAIDPYQHKQAKLKTTRADKLVPLEASHHPAHLHPRKLSERRNSTMVSKTVSRDQPGPLSTLGPFTEHYYSLVAIHALADVLKEPSLSAYHSKAIQAQITIIRECLAGQQAEEFLPLVLPPLLHIVRHGEVQSMSSLLQDLTTLIALVKRPIAEYLEDIFEMVLECWQNDWLPSLLHLIEVISVVLGDEFNVYLPILLPKMLAVLHADFSVNHGLTKRVLTALELIGPHLDDYLHLITPALMKVIEELNVSSDVRLMAINAFGRLSRVLNFSDYASRIIHPIARLLQDYALSMDIKHAAVDVLCYIVYQCGSDYVVFIPMLNRILNEQQFNHTTYTSMVSKLLKSQPLLESDLPRLPEARESRSNTAEGDTRALGLGPHTGTTQLRVDESRLSKAWGASPQSTKEDWDEWFRRLSIELVRESPEPSLRLCLELAEEHYPLVRSLFDPAFISCWRALSQQGKDELTDNLVVALKSPHIPADVLQQLLNLIEFMERARVPLKLLSIDELGALAEKARAFAKSLHYRELKFHSDSNAKTLAALVTLNLRLQQSDAARGLVAMAKTSLGLAAPPAWLAESGRWEAALSEWGGADGEWRTDPLGALRCLRALGDWSALSTRATRMVRDATLDESVKSRAVIWGATAAWRTAEWHNLSELNTALSGLTASVENSALGTQELLEALLDRAVLYLHGRHWDQLRHVIGVARDMIDGELSSLASESYLRAYDMIVQLQLFTELEELVEYQYIESQLATDRRRVMETMWQQRLGAMTRRVDHWQEVLAVRALLLPADRQLDDWLTFSRMLQKEDRPLQSQRVLAQLLGVSAGALVDVKSHPAVFTGTGPRVYYHYLHLQWTLGHKQFAIDQLRALTAHLSGDASAAQQSALLARCHLKLGEWQYQQLEGGQPFDLKVLQEVRRHLQQSTQHRPDWHKVWHAWGQFNFEWAAYLERQGSSTNTSGLDTVEGAVVTAIGAFFKAISLAPQPSLRDTLRLLTLWFKHGPKSKAVIGALQQGFGFHTARSRAQDDPALTVWLQVVPQIIARMDVSEVHTRQIIFELFDQLGRSHPQALVYPLTLSAKSQDVNRQTLSRSIMDSMRQHSSHVLDQALVVSQELIRVAITWWEAWHEGLEEASKFFFNENNIEGMLQVLQGLHKTIQSGPETIIELAFHQSFARDLSEAESWLARYQSSGNELCLHQAWDLYYIVFKQISKHITNLTSLELKYSSPKLLQARELDLAVPGTYKPDRSVVRIHHFAPQLSVISSKQRPRKLRIKGSDGTDYSFLLKGHEDLRQDERVMQLFGLVNTLLNNHRKTSDRHLRIHRYSVTPLSPYSGLIGWVPHCDTLHQLIREYRNSCEPKLPMNLETKLMAKFAGDYNLLTPIQKAEAFKYVTTQTDGQDLARVMWLSSVTSEAWLERRTNYTRSLAVMSMVGYILGLGDRHPSNIMIDRHTGHVVHIDFGDCFEVAMQRDKLPERVPFRLTRMLINAMEACGIEGTFRTTCESVMAVLRENRDNLMAVLEAFVYDPLINWRLLAASTHKKSADEEVPTSDRLLADDDEPEQQSPAEISKTFAGDVAIIGHAKVEELNARALSVLSRVHKKLTGRDFKQQEPLDVQRQVNKLIMQATSLDNLSQSYLGWCPYW